jgi:hypothetical protein
MSGSIGGWFTGLAGGSGAILRLWVDIIPNATYNLQVGAGGQGQTSATVPPTNGGNTTMSGPGGVFYSAGGGVAVSGGNAGTTPNIIWPLVTGSYLHGLAGAGGDPTKPNPAGSNGSAGLILIEWIN